MSLKELPLPSIASLRAIAALKSPHLALVRPARLGLGFESSGANQKTLAEVEDLLGGPGRLSLPYSLRWLMDAMDGLGVLHRTLSFVHGEVQPEHLVLGDDGVGRLIPVVRAHWVRGEERAPERLYYLAPEKLLGDRVDVRSDVFSLGVMLWEALAGQRLLEAHTVDDIIARLMGGGIPRARSPEAEAWTEPLAAIAERAIAVDPGRRFASVAEMSNTLQSACSRYLASPPGMAELFQKPERRARSRVRDSMPPESQRATVPPLPPLPPPADAVPTQPPPAGAQEAALAAARARMSLASVSSIDLEEETTTKERVATPVPTAAPVPVVTQARHVNTLLGVPPPFIDRESSPDAITQPFARIPTSTPVLITPLPVKPVVSSRPPAAASAAPAAVPGPSLTPWGPPARLNQPASSAPAPAPAPASVAAESRRAPSLSPLVAAPTAPAPNAVLEPSFELVRPRKRRGALWLLLGAAVAIGAFAARPWLARQVAAATGALPDNAGTPLDTAPSAPLAPTAGNGAVAPAESGSAPRVVGIASTPAMPSARAPRAHGGTREEHVVIHDSLEPQVSEPARPAPTPEPTPTTAPAPVAPPSPPPAAPSPAPKPKSVPVSDADRYGI
ncbi:MAG: protein kinase [Myxococcales bacterium]